MKLTDDQLDVLLDLVRTGIGCVSPECAQLEAYGLVVTGRSRFGAWAKPTEDGRQYVSRTLASGSRATATRSSGDTEQSISTRSDVVLGSQIAQALHRGAAPRTRRKAANTNSPERSTPVAGSADSVNSDNGALRTAAAAASSTFPNAVRVIAQGRVTYYPLASFEAIHHGEKSRVFTQNRFFRATALAASATDGDVLFDAPSSA